LTTGGALTTLVDFYSDRASDLQSELIQASDGNFYGTSHAGGSSGLGTVFKVSPAGVVTTLISFTGPNGSAPSGGLLQASDGNLYGTTSQGGGTIGGNFGVSSIGTVFKLTLAGVLTTLVKFDGTNGSTPMTALVQAGDGNFYGTTSGGLGDGTAFQLTAGGVLTTLVTFSGANGSGPSGLVLASGGNLYGTTRSGGSGGSGTVFKLTLAGVLTTAVNFPADYGSSPQSGVLLARDGSLYGTTDSNNPGGFGGAVLNPGTVFKTTLAGALSTVATFDTTNGSHPQAGLVQAEDGNFYGTTSGGGSSLTGTAYQLTPSGTLTTVVNFTGPNGSNPQAKFLLARDGNLYGTTRSGGTSRDGEPAGGGQIFRLRFRPASVILKLNANGSAGLSFQGTAAVSYRLERSTDLVSWLPLTTQTANGTGLFTYTDPAPRLTKAFYRVVRPSM
jgi:uncharacterized repeat protein (TIGR03803 family)